MRRVLTMCAVLACTHPAGLSAAEFAGSGPLPARNFAPLEQIFLNLPFERAQALRPGRFALHFESAESNEIATEQNGVEAVLKFEQNRTVLGGAVGVVPRVEVGLEVPLLSRFGGFLDGFINTTEDAFGVRNPERRLFPNNRFAAFSVRRDGVTLFDGRRQYLELGDIWATTKYEAWHVFGMTLALRGAVKAPTGRARGVFGSGKPDFALGVAAESQPFSRLLVYGNVNVIYPLGPITPGRLSLDPFVTEGMAFETYLGWRVALLLQQELYTSPFHGTGTRLLEGTVVELAAGLNWSYWEELLVQLGAIDNVSGVAPAADFTLLLRLTYRN